MADGIRLVWNRR